MATRWYWRKDAIEQGPLTFKELVVMVREKTILEDDPVRPHYASEWQPSASVVGLFHMAGRRDVLDKWEEDRRRREFELHESQVQCSAQLESNQFIAIGDVEAAVETYGSSGSDSASWQVCPSEVTMPRLLEREEQHELALSNQIAELKNQAVKAAIEKEESKRSARSHLQAWARFEPLERLKGFCSKEKLSGAFKFGLALLVAASTGAGIHNWSEMEQMRFPSTNPTIQGLRPFPLYGNCTTSEYAFLLFDSAIVGGVIGYLASRAVINMADE